MIEIFRAINDLNPIFMKKKFKLAKRASSNKYKVDLFFKYKLLQILEILNITNIANIFQILQISISQI